MKCLTWNLEWAAPGSKRGQRIREMISALDPDVACFTEVVRDLVPVGHTIEAGADYGYPNHENRRKVILWSRHPWTRIDTTGNIEMPPGRFATGNTGGVQFVGVCIPWRDAHVRTGNRNRNPWDDHLSYCRGLGQILARYEKDAIPSCVLGDFNQRVPRVNQPLDVAQALADAISDRFQIATEGIKDAEGNQLIDHFAGSPHLTISVTSIIPRFTSDGTRLSDHVGVAATVQSLE